jgi:hypothetical protein
MSRRNPRPSIDDEGADFTGVHLALPVKKLKKGELADDGYSVLQCPIGNDTPSAGRFKGPLAKQRAESKAASLNRKNGS